MNFEKILKLIEDDNGKFFILDDGGEPRLVVMSIEDYESLKNRPSYDSLAERLRDLSHQTEALNEKILEAQKEEDGGEDIGESFEFDVPAPQESKNLLDSESLYIEPIEE